MTCRRPSAPRSVKIDYTGDVPPIREARQGACAAHRVDRRYRGGEAGGYNAPSRLGQIEPR